jgi:aminoglycoside phosphotransferase
VFWRKNIVTPQRIERQGGLSSLSSRGIVARLPAEIVDVAGRIEKVTAPTAQGYCSRVLFLDAASGRFALKVADRGYRGDELHAEYLALKMLENRGLPVPAPLAYAEDEQGHYLLSSHCEGIPLSIMLRTADSEERLHAAGQMGAMLARVHSTEVADVTWQECLESQLFFADRHLAYDNLDPDELMIGNRKLDPEEILQRLMIKRPSSGAVVLLHGDYRPKNILWKDNKISCLLDWAFCDIGDPYYDLAIILYYLKTEEEKEQFLSRYAVKKLDEERLAYFDCLSKFINV